MAITITQAILAGAVYFAANTSFFMGLAYFSAWRPLVNGLLIGLLLGDPVRGAMIGASINVLYLGYISVGGTLGIGDAALAGILGSVVGIAVPMAEPAQSIGLGVLAGVLIGSIGFPLLTLRMSLDNRIVRQMERAAETGDSRAMLLWHIVGGQGLLFALTMPAATLLALLAPALLTFLTGLSPAWILHGIGVAGVEVCGALGIALALKFAFKSWGILLFFIGYALVAALHVNIALVLLPLLVGIALYAIASRQITLKPIGAPLASRSFWLWQFFSHSSYSFERLQGTGIACAMAPILQRYYHHHSTRSNALKRQLAFFNVEPNWGSIVLGILVRLEYQLASGIVSLEEVTAARQSLMGTVSGFGDNASQGAILPLLLSIGLGFSLDPILMPLPWAGACAYLLMICPLMLAISYMSFQIGFERGQEAVIALLSDTRIRRWLVIVELLGALMLGSLAAMPAVTGLHLAYANDILARLLAAVLPLVMVLTFFIILQKMNVKPGLLLLACVALCLLLALFGFV